MDMLKIIDKQQQEELIFTLPKEAEVIFLDGKLLQEEESSINYICEAFEIDRKVTNWAGLNDVLGDSGWIRSDIIYVFLTNHQLMFSDKSDLRDVVLSILSNNIEWWAGDVEKYVVEGKRKSFNVYLVD